MLTVLYCRYLISVYYVVHSMQKDMTIYIYIYICSHYFFLYTVYDKVTIYIYICVYTRVCVCVCVCVCARARVRMFGNASFGALRPPIYYSNFRGLKSYV